MKKKSIALALISAIVSSGAIVSLAQSQVITKDSENNVFISGLAPNTFGKVIYGNLPLQKTFTPNFCGIITVKSTLKEPFVFFSYSGSGTINWNLLPLTGGKPLCKLGVPNPDIPWSASGARSSDSASAGIISYIRSTTPLLITSQGNFKKRLVKANACGIISLKSTATWPFEGLGTFYFELSGSTPSDDFLSSGLATVPKPICYKGQLYRSL